MKTFQCVECNVCICTMKAPQEYPKEPPPDCPWGSGYPCEWKLLPNGGRKLLGKKVKGAGK
jgi:hypothetical protein